MSITRRQLLASAAFGAVGCAALTTALSQPAHAVGPDIPDMTGLWLGFAQSTAGVISDGFLDVHSQRDRRFLSTIEIIPCIFEAKGTLSASGRVQIVGSNADGMAIVRLQHEDFGEGGAILWDGRADVTMADGTREIASPLLLRGFDPQPDPPAELTGAWRGTAVSHVDGRSTTIETLFSGRSRAGLVASEVEIIPCVFPQGLASLSPTGQVLVIAQGAEGQAVLTGRLVDPSEIIPCVRGSYRFALLDGTTDFGEFLIEKAVTS